MTHDISDMKGLVVKKLQNIIRYYDDKDDMFQEFCLYYYSSHAKSYDPSKGGQGAYLTNIMNWFAARTIEREARKLPLTDKLRDEEVEGDIEQEVYLMEIWETIPDYIALNLLGWSAADIGKMEGKPCKTYVHEHVRAFKKITR